LAQRSDLLSLVGNLPPLHRRAQFRQAGTCKICDSPAIHFDRVDFNKYCNTENYYEFGLSGILIDYLRCLHCGYIFTRDLDDWPAASFAELIYNQDYIKVDGEYVKTRPAQYAQDFARRLLGCEHARILDYGSGAGVFVAGMRQHGFSDITAYDPFSNPQPPSGKFDIITCFEVIEHSTDPAGTLNAMKKLLREDGCIIFSQTLQPPDILAIRGSWWYLAPRNGHVSTYNPEALAELGRRQGLVFHNGANVYAFAQEFPSSYALKARACAGPAFATLRLAAPREAASSAISFPSASDILWHPTENDSVWSYRWTGAASLAWQGRWGTADCLQIRIPVLQEAEPGFGLRCEVEFAGQRQPARQDRGELVAEFDVRGRTAGQIILHTPEPILPEWDRPSLAQGPRGLAILVSQLPEAAALAPEQFADA